tara:strand:- start:132 stop:479 length:348 start_codon:yes stop_codon:yes gene_type:complete
MEFIILILLIVSILVNIFFVSYIRFLLEQLSFVSENINSLVGSVVDLRSHLSDVYELERFYGDQTLEDLLRHASATVETLQDFEDIYTLIENEEEEDEEENLFEEPEEADNTEAI